jgi:hypothetical protein
VTYKSFPSREAAQAWKHGMSEDDYWRLFDAQGGACAICGREDVRLVIDHDHGCCPAGNVVAPRWRNCGKCVRGLLCYSCNHLLGALETSAPLVGRALDFLAGDNPNGVVSGLDGTQLLVADARANGKSWEAYGRLYGFVYGARSAIQENTAAWSSGVNAA